MVVQVLQATDMEIQVKEIINIKEKLTKPMKNITLNKSYDELAKAMERDNYLSAEEAVVLDWQIRLFPEKHSTFEILKI